MESFGVDQPGTSSFRVQKLQPLSAIRHASGDRGPRSLAMTSVLPKFYFTAEPPVQISNLQQTVKMRLDTKHMRYLTGDDWKALTAVENGSKNHEVVPTALIEKLSGLR